MHEFLTYEQMKLLFSLILAERANVMHNVPYLQGGAYFNNVQMNTVPLVVISEKQDRCSAFPSADFSVIESPAPADMSEMAALCV